MASDDPGTDETGRRSPPDSDASVLVRGALFRAAAVGSGLLLSLPATVLLVRALGPRDYGAFVFAMGIVTLAGNIADLGVGNGVTRMASFASPPEDAAWGWAAARVAVVTGLAATLACVAASRLLDPPASTVLLIVAPTALAATLRWALGGHLMARRRIALFEGTLLAQQTAYYGVAIALAAFGVATVTRLAWLQLATRTLGMVVLVPAWLALTAGRPRLHGATRRLLLFSLPLLAQTLSWNALQRSDVVLLGAFRGANAVGLYSPVLRVVDVSAVILGVVGTYYLPATARMVATGKLDRLRGAYTVLTKWGLVLTAPLVAAMIVAPGPILAGLFGERFRAMATIARVLAIGYGINVLTGQNARTMTSLGLTRQIGIRSIVAFVVNLGLNAVLIPRYGALGAALGTSIVYTGLNVANSFLIWRVGGVHPIRSDFLTVVAAVVAATLAGAGAVAAAGWGRSAVGGVVVAGLVGVAGIVAARATARPSERALLRPSAWLRSRR